MVRVYVSANTVMDTLISSVTGGERVVTAAAAQRSFIAGSNTAGREYVVFFTVCNSKGDGTAVFHKPAVFTGEGRGISCPPIGKVTVWATVTLTEGQSTEAPSGYEVALTAVKV